MARIFGEIELNKMREFSRRDRWLVGAGVSIDEIGEDYAKVSMDIGPQHLNAGGMVQGGVTYTLADSAFAIACNVDNVLDDKGVIRVNQSAQITYFKPPKGDKLISEARLIAGGSTVRVYEMTVCDELGTSVARMTGNAYPVKMP